MEDFFSFEAPLLCIQRKFVFNLCFEWLCYLGKTRSDMYSTAKEVFCETNTNLLAQCAFSQSHCNVATVFFLIRLTVNLMHLRKEICQWNYIRMLSGHNWNLQIIPRRGPEHVQFTIEHVAEQEKQLIDTNKPYHWKWI